MYIHILHVIGVIALSSYLFYYLLWEYQFLFMPFLFIPTFSRTQLVYKIRTACMHLHTQFQQFTVFSNDCLSSKYFHLQYSCHCLEHRHVSWLLEKWPIWLMWMWQIWLLLCQIHCTLVNPLHSYFQIIMYCLACSVERCRKVMGNFIC
jgi:hypothetical protein